MEAQAVVFDPFLQKGGSLLPGKDVVCISGVSEGLSVEVKGTVHGG
jgi:hypothetical protein